MSQSEKIFCCFTMEGNQYLSELLLDAENTSLILHSRRPIPEYPEPHSLFGESLDYKKISLFECIDNPLEFAGDYPEVKFTKSSFPHYAVIGQRHINEEDRVFESVSFGTDDLGLLFSTSGTFGAARPDPLELEALLGNSFPSRKVAVGVSPAIFYFTGIQDSVDVDVSTGLFSVALDFDVDVSDHAGINCPSFTIATLKFKEPKTLSEVLDEVSAVLVFFTVLAGRNQGVEKIKVGVLNPSLDNAGIKPEEMSIHWSYAPTSSTHAVTNARDIPITPDVDGDEFYKVFYNWMHRHESWLSARLRIINSQKNGWQYDGNRLVAAANAFDILPDSTYPETGELSAATREARQQCKTIIRSLESGPERDQALNTLAFWGGKSLKLKVLSRSGVVHSSFGEYFKDLDSLLVIAISARNYFVHGTNNFGYEYYECLMSFLTDALEFVFVASDLIECGWDAKRWADKCPGFSHPLAAFYRSYHSRLPEFLSVKQKAKK